MAEALEEVAVLVQRVVKDINNAFKRNPHIDEIGLIPCPEARYNRSPIILVENKLGVESWCVKFLLPYVHNKLLHYRQRKQRLNKEGLLFPQRDGNGVFGISPKDITLELIDITCTLLLLNPDFATAWNVRKELIVSGTLNPVKDLHLGKLALTKFPKSPETWIHRRWVLQQLIQQNPLPILVTKENLETPPSERMQQLVKEEMDVCCEAAGRYPSNYNAWSHRIWVLQHLAKLSHKILLEELSATKHWVSMHVSDHSGFHYRQFLLKSLIGRTMTGCAIQMHDQLTNQQTPSFSSDEGSDRAEAASMEDRRPGSPLLLKEEIQLCTDLIHTYPGHETLWCHRRHVFCLQHHLKNKVSPPSFWSAAADNSDGTLNSVSPGVAFVHVTQSMDVDSVIEFNKQGYTQETKRLKRAPMQDFVSLEVECRFIDQVLSACRDLEQARFAGAYRKWLVSFLGQ